MTFGLYAVVSSGFQTRVAFLQSLTVGTTSEQKGLSCGGSVCEPARSPVDLLSWVIMLVTGLKDELQDTFKVILFIV